MLKQTSTHFVWIHHVWTLALLTLSAFGLNQLPARAEEQATQLHQLLHQMDFTPAAIEAVVTGQPLIQVKINGTPATFLVDTGASSSIINTELTQRLNLRTESAVNDDGKPVYWNKKQGNMTEVEELGIGSVHAYHARFLVLDEKDFNVLDPKDFDPAWKNDAAHAYDGVIGINVLQSSAILLDSQQHKFGFIQPGNLSLQQLSQIGFSKPYILSLTRSYNRWFVSAELTNAGASGHEDLLLDTGANNTKISNQLCEKLHIKITGLSKQHTAYNISLVGTGQAETMQIGDMALLNVPLVILPDTQESSTALGMDILSGYRVLMDFPGGKMYLQPNNAITPAITVAPQPGAVSVGQRPGALQQ